MDNNEYQIQGNTISKKEKPKDYEIINGIKYPKNTDNKKVQKMKDEASNLRDEADKISREKYLNDSISSFKQFFVDNVDNSAVKIMGNIHPGYEATENLHMSKKDSYMNTNYAKEHKVYNNYKEAPAELQEYLKKKISEQIGKDKIETTKGIYINKESTLSKKLAEQLMKEKNFIKLLKEYEKPLNHKYTVDDSLNFDERTWHNALGNVDIKKMQINKNGDLELYVTDTYDFNKNEKKGAAAVGRDRQEKGEIIPYFLIYQVVIPKEQINKVFIENYK